MEIGSERRVEQGEMTGEVAGGMTGKGRRVERGAALLVVLAIMVVSSMLAISSFQSSLLQERLAGNYRATIQAQMAAESGVAMLSGYVAADKAQRAKDWPALEDSSLDLALARDAAVMPLPSCDDAAKRRALWANDKQHVDLTFNNAAGQASSALLAMCQGVSGVEVAVLGLSGSADAPAMYPATVRLESVSQGLATTNFIGGIDKDASIQWPTSANSRLGGGVNGQAIYFDHLTDASHSAYFQALIAANEIDRSGYRSRDKTNLIASMGNQVAKVVDGVPSEVITAATPGRDGVNATIALLRDIYEACQGGTMEGVSADPSGSTSDLFLARASSNGNGKNRNNGKNGNNGNGGGNGNGNGVSGGLCTNIRIVPPGAGENDDRLRGQKSFNGLYIDLSGKLDIRGNSRVLGAAVVANVKVLDDGSWASLPNHTIKLAGGGNSGTVWYNATNIVAAIRELKQLNPDAFGELDIETFWGAGRGSQSGWKMPGWMESVSYSD